MKVVFLCVFLALACSVSAYSMKTYLYNQTPYPMFLAHYNCSIGHWVTLPPQSINPGTYVQFFTDGGTLGGTRASFIYSVASGGPQMYFWYNVPTFGSNSFAANYIPPNYVTYSSGSDSSGSVVSVYVTQHYVNEEDVTPKADE